MGSRHHCLLCLAALVFSICSPTQSTAPTPNSPAQEPAPEQKQKAAEQPNTVYESATVLRAVTRLVVVDVVATNGSGEAITDLKAEDFTVVEDGHEQKIRAFSFQHPPAGGSAPVRLQPANLPPNVFSNVPKYTTEDALNVLLLDGLNTNLPNQAYARDQMIKYLAKIPEGQPIAVYMLMGRQLRLIQDFTSDPSVLKNAVKNLKSSASPLQDNPGGGPDMELAPPGAFDSGMIPAQMQQAMQEFENERVSFQTDLRVRYTLDALNSLARTLSGYGGRKNLIWISEAFPISIDPDLTLSTGSFNSTRNYAPEIGETAEYLTDAQIAIYPVDARGLVTWSVFSAENRGDKFGRSLGRPGRMQQAISAESAALAAAHATMNDLADRTGGRAFYNRNDLDGAIRKGIEDGSTYYTLAYYPENKNWNGKFRKIHIKVNRSGVKLRHRLGYYALDPNMVAEADQKRRAATFGKALSLDYPVSTALRFHAGVVQPSDKTENKVLVNFGIDPHAISFEKKDDGLQHAIVDCAVQAYTEKGKLIKTEVTTLTLALKPDTFNRVMQTIVPCQRYIDLAPGNYLLRLGVMDDRTSLIGTTNARVTITLPTAAQKQ